MTKGAKATFALLSMACMAAPGHAATSVSYSEAIHCLAVSRMSLGGFDPGKPDRPHVSKVAKAIQSWTDLVQRLAPAGKSASDAMKDIDAAQAEYSSGTKVLLDRYKKSDPALRLAPYYIKLTEKERSDLLRRMSLMHESAIRKTLAEFERCSNRLALIQSGN